MNSLKNQIDEELNNVTLSASADDIRRLYGRNRRKVLTTALTSVLAASLVIVAISVWNANMGVITDVMQNTGRFLSSYFGNGEEGKSIISPTENTSQKAEKTTPDIKETKAKKSQEQKSGEETAQPSKQPDTQAQTEATQSETEPKTFEEEHSQTKLDNGAYINDVYQYRKLSDGTIELLKYVGSAKTLYIPETIDGYIVSAIGEKAVSNVSSLSIPKTVVKIADGAIRSVQTRITVDAGNTAFKAADNLLTDIKEQRIIAYPYAPTKVEIPSGVTEIGSYAFYDTRVESLKLPSSVRFVGDYAFFHSTDYNNSKFEKVEFKLPKGIEHVGNCAFSGCAGLTVDGMNDLEYVGDKAFFGCNSIKWVTLGKSIKHVGALAFGSCKGLETVIINTKTSFLSAFEKCSSLRSVTLGEGVESVSPKAFSSCENLSFVTLPLSLKSIGAQAFLGCTDLAAIDIPDKVTVIGDRAFYWCHSLTDVKLSKKLETIGSQAFLGCNRMIEISMPVGIQSIGVKGVGFDSGGNRNINFLVKGYGNTVAQTYAKENKLHFQSIGDYNGQTSVKLKSYAATIYVGETAKIEPIITNPDGNTAFTSSDGKIAAVSAKGNVKAISKGVATITVENNGVKRQFVVEVKNPKLNFTKKSIKVGESYKLKVKGNAGELKFKSSDKKVVTVDKNGKVTAKKKGTAEITVTTGGFTLKCKVTVK